MKYQHPSIMPIVERVAALYLIDIDDLLGKSHRRTFVEARRVAQWVAWRTLTWSCTEVATAFGVDHSSILLARRSVERRFASGKATPNMLAVRDIYQLGNRAEAAQ